MLRTLLFALFTSLAAFGVTVDRELPAGNIIVDGIEGDTVFVRQDLSTTDRNGWFYWAFRVKGAAGRTLTFDFKNGYHTSVGPRGPVVTLDRGKTYSYPCDTDGAAKHPARKFTYTFPNDADEVWFYECFPYQQAQWDAFVAKHAADRGTKFTVETLCRSRKGDDVPRARFGCISRPPRYRIFMSARHHCSETTASWVLEGVAEAFLAEDELGAWLRENVELMMVPMTDYDGVQAGDQGKNRPPHDHNRDYSEFIYPETKAITEWIATHAGGKLDVFIDVHCPWIRGAYNEWLYTPWKDPKIVPSAADEKRFSELLEKLQCGSMRYKAANDLPFGKAWNKGVNYEQGWSAVIWACQSVKGLRIARSYEVPFANANGAVVTPATCRELGHDTAKVFRAFLTGDEGLPYCVDGIYPHLAMFNGEGECGTGAVVPWAGSLWAVTYGPHCPLGSTDKLYEITPDLKQIIHPESVGGTPANRLIHRETNQLLIGPYVIDAKGGVRVVPPARMPGRLTGAARHLVDPANLVYVATMDNGLYELDMRTLAVKTVLRDHNGVDGKIWGGRRMANFPSLCDWGAAKDNDLPGSHTKGICSGFGRIQLANNGEYHPEAKTNPWIPAGVLGDCAPDGSDLRVIRRCQFTDVVTKDGIYGNEHPESNPIWSLGWDAKSVILAVTTNGADWAYYRLPKASHAYDGAHGWNTEWPRIREIGEGDLLATMHGTFWRFPRDFSPAQPNGIRPLSTYLKVIGDFCLWQDRIVFGCDDQAKNEFLGTRALKKGALKRDRSQSNLWFVKPEDLTSFGPPSGEGWVWNREDVKAGEVSDPFLYAGYDDMRFSFTDAAGRSVRHELVREGDWVRVKALEDAKGANAHFRYGPKRPATLPKTDGFVEVYDDYSKRTYRFPNVNGDRTVICREVSTERDLLYAGGVFYEVPADNAGGFAELRPVALADEPVRSIESRLGLLFINGKPMALDTLWKNGTAAQAYWLWEDAITGGKGK